MSHEQEAVKEILKGIRLMLNSFYDKTTKIYDGIIVSSSDHGKWNVQFHGETHPLKPYGAIEPKVGMMVKVQIPQGNMSLAYFI